MNWHIWGGRHWEAKLGHGLGKAGLAAALNLGRDTSQQQNSNLGP